MSSFVVRAGEADPRFLTLRRDLLRAGFPLEEVAFPGDEAPGASHWLAEDGEGSLLGIASFLPNPEAPGGDAERERQLRGMAVVPAWHRRGVGRALLEAAEEQARRERLTSWWANARIGAVSFYRAMGWRVVSEEFDIPGVGPHVRIRRILVP